MDSVGLVQNQKPYNNWVKWKRVQIAVFARRAKNVGGREDYGKETFAYTKPLQNQPVKIIKNTICKTTLYCYWRKLMYSLTQKLKPTSLIHFTPVNMSKRA